MMETSFFIARQTIISTPGAGMMPWREHLIFTMSRNARSRLLSDPMSNRVIELEHADLKSDIIGYCGNVVSMHHLAPGLRLLTNGPGDTC